MKRILTVMLVMIFSAGMVSAADRLELNGQVRVQGFAIENYGNLDSDDDSDKKAWFGQRFRLGAKINVMEGVTANLRFDFAEDMWGSDNWEGVRYGSGSELQVDRAYLQIVQDAYVLKAGQHYQGLGNSIVVDQNVTGFTFQMKLPVTIDLQYAKTDEGGSARDDSTFKDTDYYGINAGFSQDNMSGNFFIAMSDRKGTDTVEIDGSDYDFNDDAQIVIGLQGSTDLDGLKINGELNYFTGDAKVADSGTGIFADVDYVGLQLYVDANTTVNDATIGGLLLYSMGTDKGDELQLTELSDFGSFAPLSFGILDFTDWGAIEDGLGRSSFDTCGTNAGIMALSVYGEKMVVDKLTVRGQLAYAMPSEDDVAVLDSAVLLNAGVEYELLKDLSLFLSANYVIADAVGAGSSDDPFGLASMIRLNF